MKESLEALRLVLSSCIINLLILTNTSLSLINFDMGWRWSKVVRPNTISSFNSGKNTDLGQEYMEVVSSTLDDFTWEENLE